MPHRYEKRYTSSEKKKTYRQTKKIGSLKKQLQYLKRNLDHIEQLLAEGASLQSLKKRDYCLTPIMPKRIKFLASNKQVGLSNPACLAAPIRLKANEPKDQNC